MAVRLEEWTQSHWITPGVNLYANYGDYWELSNLLPRRDGKQLVRVPGWSAQVRTDTNGLTDVRGAFYDADNSRVVLIGADGSSDLSASYLDASWSLSAKTVLNGTPTNLGGASMRNVLWFGGVLYVIGSDGKVYSGSAYTAALSEFDGTTTHRIISAIDERFYVILSSCDVYINAGDLASIYQYDAPYVDMGDPQAFIGYRGYGLLIVKAAAGRMVFIRVPLDTTTKNFQEITHLEECGSIPSYGSLYVLHGDEVYFSPGYYTTLESKIALNVYSFNGSRIERVDTIEHAVNTGGSGYPTSAGLLSWRGELLYYALEGTAQTFKVLKGGRFTEFPTLSATASAQPFAAVVGGHLVATADDTNEGVHYLTTGTLSDGYVVTSKLDMGRPGREKRLERITVLLDDHAASFKPTIYYRVNDATTWTSAVAGSNSRRVSVGSLGVDFYTLQVKVLLDDDTGNNEDIRLEGISVLYSVGDV